MGDEASGTERDKEVGGGDGKEMRQKEVVCERMGE
jgi:hypothetical protein